MTDETTKLYSVLMGHEWRTLELTASEAAEYERDGYAVLERGSLD